MADAKEAKIDLRWEGIVEITVFDLNGKTIAHTEFHNILHDVGLNMMRDLLEGVVADGEIKYLAVGSSDAAIDVTDTTLTTETSRKQVTTKTAGAVGILVTETYLAPADAVGAIEELGWFAGAAAGAGAGSGIMISRVLYSRTKTNLESIMVKRTDTISEVA